MHREPSDMVQIPPRGSRQGRGWRVAVAVPALLALAGCGQGRDAFAPPCPAVHILPEAGDLTRSRGGPDLTDMVLRGRITGVSGDCKMAEPGTEKVDVSIRARLTRGPAGGATAQVPYFVAVSEGDHILDKLVQTKTVRFGSNEEAMDLTLDPVELNLPVSTAKAGDAYTVWVGFQLTPEEMAHNRRAGQ